MCKAPADTSITIDAARMQLPFMVGMVMEVQEARDTLTIQWYVPGVSPMIRYGGGKRALVIDLFGSWVPSSSMQVADLASSNLPSVIFPLAAILEFNIDLDDGKLSYDLLDRLRDAHGIDVTAISMSQTQLGGIYRAHVLMSSKRHT